MATTISIVLDTRRIKKTKKYPVKLRVTSNRAVEYYQTVFDLSEEEFNRLSASRVSAQLQTIRDKLKEIERSASNFIEKLSPFEFSSFELQFIQDNKLFCPRRAKLKQPVTIEAAFDYAPFEKKFPILLDKNNAVGTISFAYSEYIKPLLREGRISTAVNYHCSYVSLKKFRGNVRLADITPSYLTEFTNYMFSRDISRTTVGFYLRPLRCIFNESIENGIITREKHYHFGRRKYQIPTSKNIKKSLDLQDIEKIYNYVSNPLIESEQKAKDYWLFSYFGNGMNPKDIASLKYRDLQGEYLVFERSKTERAMRSSPNPITVFITEDIQRIIDRWGNSNKAPGNYIFPVFEPGLSPMRLYDLKLLFVCFINSWMKEILKKLGINKKATTYVARHSFSTIMKRSGSSTEYIQEALGHADMKTTESYLGSFDKEIKKEFSRRLTSFKTSK